MNDERDERGLRYIRHIERDLAADPAALDEEGRTSGRSILWSLMTLADMTTRLSDGLRHRHPEIDWAAIRGFRNLAAHVYDRLRLREVRAIVTDALLQLRAVVDRELAALRRGS